MFFLTFFLYLSFDLITFAALKAAFGRYDVVHFHAEGPCAMMWIPKLFGKKCIATVHGLDHQRAKWGRFASFYIFAGEKCAVKFADEIIVVDTGSGIINAGDVVSFAGDAEKYVIGKGIDAPGVLEINDPGLRAALADGVAMTSEKSYTPCIALHRNAIVLVTRPPASPFGGDAAEDVTYVTDPVTGLTFEIRLYKGRRCITYEVGIAWGVKCVNPHLVATLMG